MHLPCRQQPRRVGVVGAGYVAVEMAGILHAFGSETTLLFRGETVLRYGYDKCASSHNNEFLPELQNK
jgi:pyruvate/2-oxoglutarate dehydrogenase complex dihydrolipoamide dehydrogenase (E3) component